LEAGQNHGAVEIHAPVPVNAPAAGGHGLYDALYLHPGVWFLLGCIFIVFLLIVREIYYKKRAK